MGLPTLLACLVPGLAGAADDGFGLDAPADTVGAAGDPAALVIHGATQVPAADIRTAVAGCLDLLAPRQESAPLGAWLDTLATTVREGYHQDGFRAAEVHAAKSGAGIALDIVEGQRSRCGVLRITATPELTAILAQTFAPAADDPDADGPTDIDTAPKPAAPLWSPGQPVDWRNDTLPQLVHAASETLRDAGYAGARVTVTEVAAAPGITDLAIAVTHDPVAVRLGEVRITGIPPDQAGKMRAWLALPPDAPADGPLATAVRQRLRACGRFVRYQVAWEDYATFKPKPGQPLGAILDDWMAAFTTAGNRIAARGRSDLLISVKPYPDVPPPWEAARTWDCVMAARAAFLSRLNAGQADLVIENTVGDKRARLTWSPHHGLALQILPAAGGPAIASVICSATGFIGTTAGTSWALTSCGAELKLTMGMDPKDDLHGTLNASLAPAQRGIFRVLATFEPVACGVAMLGRGDGKAVVAPTWDGPVMVIRKTTDSGVAEEFRADPDQGFSQSWTLKDGGGGSFRLVGHAWDALAAVGAATSATSPARATTAATVANAAAAASATASATSPRPATVGDLLAFGEALGATPMPEPLRSVVAPFPIGDRLQSLDAGNLGQDDPTNPTFSLDDTHTLATVPMINFLVARLALSSESHLATGLTPAAWPRRLLRATALAMIGGMPVGAAALRPLFDDPDIGPLGFLVCSHLARLAGIEPLTVAYADAGLAHCDADGLAADARALAGYSDGLITAMGFAAGIMAGHETDPQRAARLRAFVTACAGKDHSPARLEMLARDAAGLGIADWLQQKLKDCENSAASFW